VMRKSCVHACLLSSCYPVRTDKSTGTSVRANISDKPVRQAGRLRGVLLSDKTVRQE
jgi:hypothetical protein